MEAYLIKVTCLHAHGCEPTYILSTQTDNTTIHQEIPEELYANVIPTNKKPDKTEVGKSQHLYEYHYVTFKTK